MRGVSIALLFSVILSINVFAAYCPTTLSIASNDMLLLGTLNTAFPTTRVGGATLTGEVRAVLVADARITMLTCRCTTRCCNWDTRNTELKFALIIALRKPPKAR